jgi:hypothetical protein
MFRRISNGKPSWGTQPAPIADREVADVVHKLLNDMGYPCHVILIQMRTTESKIAKNLADLGFVFEEKEN